MKTNHHYDTGNGKNYHADVYKFTYIFTLSPRLWNSLPKEMTNKSKFISQFKCNISYKIEN